MYSILFMIGMPATIFTGFGISFYRMASREQQQFGVETDSSGVAGGESPAAGFGGTFEQ